jgi:hypothetical protein
MLKLALTELYRALVRWDGPKHPALNTYSARLRSFDRTWSHHIAEVFSGAGFFYTGTDLTITPVQKRYSFYITPIYNYLSFFLTGRDDETVCFHFGGGLETWLATDDPWSDHMAWFPNCIYIRYIRRGVVPPTKQESTSWSCTLK